MHPETKNIWKSMQDLSFHMLGKALRDCTFNEMGAPYAHTMSIVNTAHGAELLLKARIAKEHPLLIFEKLPKPSGLNILNINSLIENGTTVKYSELPDLLWASTGYAMSAKHKKAFTNFGIERNRIVHLGLPGAGTDSTFVMSFLLETLDYICQDIFEASFVLYADEFDEVTVSEGYLKEQIDDLKLNIHPTTLVEIEKRMAI
jgi:hypothetical protein